MTTKVFSPPKYRIPEIAQTMHRIHDYRMLNRSERDERVGQKIRALIVDDCEMLLAKLREMLVTMPHIEVVAEASNGEEALRQAQEAKPDLVIMDIQMPVMDGVEAAQRMKVLLPEIFIVLTSAFHRLELFHLPRMESVEFAPKSQLWNALPKLVSGRFPALN